MLRFSEEEERKVRGPAYIHHPDYYRFTRHTDGRPGVWDMNLYEELLEEMQDELEGEHIEPEELTREEALLIHTPEYVKRVYGDPEGGRFPGGAPGWAGGPWDKSAQKAVLRSAGGMVRANYEALDRGASVQLYDAFHHAYPDYGEGFCVLNDVAIAAKKLSKEGHKVMVVDTDVHQGQGTAVCAADDENIYTISTHERENYPHKKELSSKDLELERGITDNEYLRKLWKVLEEAIEEFGKPDIAMYVAGTDLYQGDKLSNTKITLEGIQARDRLVLAFFGKMGVPVATSIPQGYAQEAEDSKTMMKNTLREVQRFHKEYFGA